jgi:hypothetical protein
MQYNAPKIANPVSLASQHSRAPLKIGFTHFHGIQLQIWIFDDKTLDVQQIILT